MTWFEDDSQGISDEIRNMTREELDAIIAAYEEEGRKRRLAREQARSKSAN
jgi:hypothetical protein